MVFALPIALVLLLAGAVAAAAAANTVLWLLAGRTYRFSLRIELTAGAPLDADALLQAIEAGGGHDVLITKGAPVVAIYVQTIVTDHPVELGKPRVYALQESELVLTLLDVQELPNV